MAGAAFTFASMIRRGFVADQDGMIDVGVLVPGTEAITRRVPVMTSGDVAGIPSRQVIRCTPVNGLVDAEPNYLATIEFDAPDLPWMFSRQPASGPTLPWLTLAVIDVTDLAADPLAASPVGTQLTIAAAQLPNPADAWRWAHAQLLEADTVPGDPARSLSRLVSSRKLEQNRRYLACVVPVFAAGRVAGLGIDPGDLRTSLELAWDPAGGDVVLPVYYFWRFGTGPDGDFESLVRRLHGVPLPSGLGRRKLVLDWPGTGLPVPDADGAEVELQVALRPPGESLDAIAPLVGASYLDALRARLVDAGYDTSLLTATPGALAPAVGPPVYGQLAVGVSAAAAGLATLAPPWVREANLDPRLRVAAGLGSEVVRRNQERYVEAAWRQVGDVLGANMLRRRAEFSLAASATLHRKWITRLPVGDLVTSTAPVHARVFVGDELTITGRLRQSPLPPSIASVEYRRVTRVRGRLSGAAAWHAAVGPAALAARAPSAQPLAVTVPLDTIDRLDPPSRVWGVNAAPSILARLVPEHDRIGLTAAEAATRLDSLSGLTAVELTAPASVASHATSIDPAHVLTAIAMEPAGSPGRSPAGTIAAPVAAALKLQMAEVAKRLIDRQIAPTDARVRPEASLAGGFAELRDRIITALDPGVTIHRMVNHRISGLTPAEADGLDDVMAAPDLSEPTYQALAEISHDWLLPGIDTLPADTTTVVESNRAFISAFLVGMNHEVARELLWREYPTDQRGTWCRQFWPHRDTGEAGDRYDLVHPLHASAGLTLPQLGERPGSVASPLVLVVKGDLVRRYPGMLVTAAKTRRAGAVRTLDPATELQPDFMARLEPDVLLVGFAGLGADDVWAAGDDEATAWWFFFAEHFTEPRFGLDQAPAVASSTLADWNDASWGQAVLDTGGRLDTSSFDLPPLPKSRPGLPPGAMYDWHGSSSSTAWILLQYPFRRGVRATDLLPPRPQP